MDGLMKGLMDVAFGKREDDDDNNRHSQAPKIDGLIKGLVNVALGNREEDEDNNRQSQEERSRSSWAQVVSGEQDNDEVGAHEKPRPNNTWNRKEEAEGSNADLENVGRRRPNRPQKEDDEGSNADWENVGRRRPNRPQKEDDEGSNADWENVGRRHSNRPQKEDDEGSNADWENVGRRRPNRPQKVSMYEYKRPPSEQDYSDDVDYGSHVKPSEAELSDLSKACSRLWELDANRLAPGTDYEIDCGEGKKAYQKEDMAQGSLFNWLSNDIFKRPTYARFCSLLDNYNPNEGCKEVVTTQERQEQAAFIEEISRTPPIKYLHKYLVSSGIISDRTEDFKRKLTSLWFDLYGRSGSSGSSSAFEHVFVGEIKQRAENEVSGFHNWIQFYLEESKGRVDYQGYIFPRRRGEIPDSETQLLTVQFEWNGILKSLSSTLIGVSPEFEIALFTLCFFLGGEDNHVQLGPYSVNIKCYRMGNDKIGSVFPIAES